MGGSKLSALGVLYVRAMRESRRVAITTWVVPLVLPIFMLTIFAEVFSVVARIPGFGTSRYQAYLTPAAVLMAVMLGSATAAISTAVERQTGFYQRLQGSPLGVGLNVTARRLADGTRLACFAATLVVVAGVSGITVRNWWLGLGMTIVLASAWGVAYGGLALSLCIKTASAEPAQALVPLFFPVLFMSTAFMPMTLLPSWLHGIARYNPVSYLCDAMRDALAGSIDGGVVARACAGILALGLVTEVLVRRAQRMIAEQ